MNASQTDHRADCGDVGSDLQARVAQLQTQLDLLKAQVRQAQQLSSLGTAAAMIAHEVNNLLTPIQGYVQAALESQDASLRDKALQVTMKNVRILIGMSERVLQIGAAKPAKRELTSVRAAAEDAVASLCRDLEKDGITFECKVEDSVRAWSDPLQLRQVFFNLFLNAREAMAPSHGGRLAVRAQQQHDKTHIEVRNTGVPIPPDVLPHILDTFQSSKVATSGGRTRCSGLGLALCRDLIKDNAGTIAVTSGPETGTVFTIVLPASEIPHA